MISPARRFLMVAALSYLGSVAHSARGQPGDEIADNEPGTERPAGREAEAFQRSPDVRELTLPMEEIVVRGGSIWKQIERAEDRVFDRFNAINSDDDFDISCRFQAEIGTKIKKRVCAAKFWRDEDANVARDTIYRLQGSSAGDVAMYWAVQRYKRDLMLEEMTRLAQEDTELRAALENLVDVQRVAAAPLSSSTREVVLEDDEELPFDAELIVAGRVGRRAWTHALRSRTFTLTDVDGQIHEMEAECDETRQPLEYQSDVEWTLPGAWRGCELRIEAMRGTTFYLVEFDSPDLDQGRARASGCWRCTAD